MTTAALEQEQLWAEEHTKPPFLRRVRIRGYKSIAFCDVKLQPFTILVGRNGSGKSNFLDALAFLRDAMALGIPEATKNHGGPKGVLCRTTESPMLRIDIVAKLPNESRNAEWLAEYSLQLELNPHGNLSVRKESLRGSEENGVPGFGFDVNGGQVTWFGYSMADGSAPLSPPDRLWLPLSFRGDFKIFKLSALFEAMKVYNFSPEAMRELRRPLPGYFLERNGSNLASVIQTLKDADPNQFQRARDYLSYMNDDIESFDPIRYGDFETVQFHMKARSGKEGLTFNADSMSDGTLRALAAMMAGFQVTTSLSHPSVVAIEEPETSLHPEAARDLVGALRGATEHTQILLTSHSADFLDDRELQPAELLVVRSKDGQTQIAPVDPASREIVRRQLDSFGGLQRSSHLEPDWYDLERQTKVRSSNGE